MKRFVGTFLIIVVFVLLFLQTVHSCTCTATPIGREYKRASSVFIGQVIDVQSFYEARRQGKYANLKYYFVNEVYRFKISKVYKGEQVEELTVFAGTDCGTTFKKGGTYLVYARKIDGGFFVVGICSRSGRIDDDDSHSLRDYYINHDLRYLERNSSSRIYTYIYGHIDMNNVHDNPTPFKSHKITLRNSQHTFESITDSSGDYFFENIPVAMYSVDIKAPKTHIIQGSTDIDLSRDSCIEQDFYIIPNGIISGIVKDKRGKPLRDIGIDLVRIEDTVDFDNYFQSWEYRADAYTSLEGKYSIPELSPGKYYVGINIYSKPKAEQPFPARYYPSVNNKKFAKIITLGLGQKIDGINIQIDSTIPSKTIVGDIKFNDGSFIKHGYISLYFDSTLRPLGESASINSLGKFEIKTLSNSHVWIVPKIYDYNYSKDCSIDEPHPYEIDMRNNLDTIHFVIQRYFHKPQVPKEVYLISQVKKTIAFSILLFTCGAIFAHAFRRNSHEQ